MIPTIFGFVLLAAGTLLALACLAGCALYRGRARRIYTAWRRAGRRGLADADSVQAAR